MYATVLTVATQEPAGSTAAGLVVIGVNLFMLAIGLVILAGVWKMFTKAGQPGWMSLIPIYNIVVMLRIAGRPGWWTLLLFVPVVGFVFGFIALLDLAKAFGRGVGYAIGLAVLPFFFFPHLGLGSPQYEGA